MHRLWAARAALLLAALVVARPAAAHEVGGGFVLLLPTHLYVAGAGLAVLASFLLLAAVPPRRVARLYDRAVTLPAPPRRGRIALSLLSTLFVMGLIVAGIAGPEDPLSNPLPYGVWTLGWVCMTLACAVFGDLWPWLNPWSGLLRVAGLGRRPVLRLPARLGHGIALLQLAGILWVDRISIHSVDPDRLTDRLAVFWLFNLAGMVVFGRRDWCARAEPLHVTFRLIGRLAPLGPGGAGRIALRWPGGHALTAPPLAPGELAFALLLLAAGTFDGLISTFAWLGFLGLNPLEFGGRSTVTWPNTLGLGVAWATLAAIFCGAVALGAALAGARPLWQVAAARLGYSLIPIAIAYHAAHFLPHLLVDLQDIARIASDPLARGWDLFGTARSHATLSMFSDPGRAVLIYDAQTALILGGHLTGIALAHATALQVFGTGARALRSQIPLAAVMVGYTALGLWLLSQPQV
ncbi:hypothetical protein [Mesobaculum littorinae]|uniref:hypothetical protein n=1 Tax=Mesobaculum littorinae TaxID=2486419 RepID=UPI0013E34E21|nr:hypothetical protein [Mesobaculum littorinae]